MDFNTIVPLDEDSGVVEHLKDPTGTPEYFTDASGKKHPVTMTIMGSYSTAFKNAARAANEKRKDAAQKGETLTDVEEEALDFETEAACIKAWVFTQNGQPMPITGANWK